MKTAYERSRPGINQLGCWHDRQRTPFQDGDCFGNYCRLVPGFLRQRSGMFPERFRRTSIPVHSRDIRPSFTRAPKMRNSVLLNSWDRFLVNLPPISSETCPIYSSVIPGASVFCSWDTFVFPLTQLPTFAYFSKLPSLGKSFNRDEDWDNCIFEDNSWLQQKCSFSFSRKNSFQLITVNQVEQKLVNVVCTVLYNKNIIKSTFASPIDTFSVAGNIIVYAPS